MADRLDIMLLGATGFTGMHCIPYIHKLSTEKGHNLTWGVAGRSEEKLKLTLEKMGKKIEVDFQKIPIVVVDINNAESLLKMAHRAKVVINCCGPYYFLGEPVVKACIAAGAHHVDISAEPQYMERVQLEQHEAAREKGVYVVSACGVDSIPTDLGVVFLQQEFKGTLNSVVAYLETWEEDRKTATGSAVNYGTWHSAVNVVAHWNELKELRKKLLPKNMPEFQPKLKNRFFPYKSNDLDGWVAPYPGADSFIIKRSQTYFYEADDKRPVQAGVYILVKSFWELMALGVLVVFFGIFSKFSCGRKLLLDYPEFFGGGFFSKKPPSEDRTHKTWLQVTLHGEGWKKEMANKDDQFTTPCDRRIVGRVKGRNPGYATTCAAVVLSAIMILTEKDKMPEGGGVFPPAAAFAKTSLVKQLNENGLTFDIISEKDL